MGWIGLALLAATTAWGADVDPVAVLIRVRDGVLAHAERIPNHTCVETIVRDWYDGSAASAPRSCDALLGRRKRAGVGTLVRLTSTDRLRLDVALAAPDEIYSWAGAKRFETSEIDELILSGAIGTGPFAGSLLSLFEAPDPNFMFEGEVVQNGRHLLEYSFRISEEQSHYRVRAGKQWVNAGYTGKLVADPATAELVRIDLRTEELPRATYACEVDTSMEYGMVRLGGEEYLLPAMTRQRFINQDGSEAENAITFSACREFLGESTVNFGASPAAVGASKEASALLRFELPSGVNVTVETTSALDLDKAAAGDLIAGRLAAPILDLDKKTVLVPAGAVLEGRLMRVETRYGRTNQQEVALRWETMELDGVVREVSLVPDWKTASDPKPKTNALGERGWAITLPRKDESRYAAYHFPGDHVVVKAGLVSKWFTSKF